MNDWADFWYYKIGINVIPADTVNKKTSIKWGAFQETPIDEIQHKAWKAAGDFEKGLGIISGKIFRGDFAGYYFVFIDLDNKKGIDEFCTRNGVTMPLGKLAEKWLVETHVNPNKAHVYVISPIPFPKKSSDAADAVIGEKIAKGEAPAIEVKGEGKHGIAYASGSPHKDGTRYSIIGTMTPEPLTEEQAKQLLDHVSDICKRFGIKYLEDGTHEAKKTPPLADYMKKEFRIKKGERHNTLVSVIAKMAFAFHDALKKGAMTEDEFRQKVWKFIDEHCDEPFNPEDFNEHKEVEDMIVTGIAKYGLKFKNDNEADEGEEDDDERRDLLEELSDLDRQVEYAVEYITQRHVFKTFTETGEIFFYDNGIYKHDGDKKIHEYLAKEVFKSKLKPEYTVRVQDLIRGQTYVSQHAFDNDPNLLHVANGWLNLESRKLEPDTPERLSLVRIPVTYDPKCHITIKEDGHYSVEKDEMGRTKGLYIMEFLREVLTPKDFRKMIRFLGYLLYKSCRYEKALMLVGEGANGKSTLINVIRKFLGNENIAEVDLHELLDNAFLPAELHGKLANLAADVGNKKLESTNLFKKLVSGDGLTVQKKYQKPFNLLPYAKMIFSSNEPPRAMNDESYAYYRRWCVIFFNKTFEGEKRETGITPRLTADRELSGLLNLALVGLSCLRKENGFEEDYEEIKNALLLGNSKLLDFIRERCVYGLDEYIVPCGELREQFYAYCTEKGVQTQLDERELGKKLAEIKVTKFRPRVGKERVTHYKGIAFKTATTETPKETAPIIPPPNIEPSKERQTQL
jgi:P4 family phage/plasmid primase-like protien